MTPRRPIGSHPFRSGLAGKGVANLFDEALQGEAPRAEVRAAAMLSAANTLRNLLTIRTAPPDGGLARQAVAPLPVDSAPAA
jgi:hypothetical protein